MYIFIKQKDIEFLVELYFNFFQTFDDSGKQQKVLKINN